MKWMSALALLVAVSLGQSPPGGPSRPPHAPKDPQHNEKMHMMKMWKLTEELKLTEDQGKVFFPRHNSFTDEMFAMNEKQNDLLKRVDEMLEKGGKVNEKDISDILQQVTEIEKNKLDKRREFFLGLDDVLTPEQRAKFLVFEGRFKRELWHQVRGHSGMESEMPGPMMKSKKKWRRP